MENEKTTEEAVSTVISLRVPNDLFERLEAERKRRGEQVGMELPRTSTINTLLGERLDRIEASMEGE
jgi:hypothetical protein